MTLYKLIQLSVFFSFIYGISYASTVSTPAKNSVIVVSHTPTHKKEFIGLSHPEALAKASELKAYLVDLENRKMGKHDSIDPKHYRRDFKKFSQIEAIEKCADLKGQITELETELGIPHSSPAKSVVSSPVPTVVSTAEAASEQADLNDILHKLDDVTREVRALRVHSNTTTRNLSGAFDQHATADDRALDLAFKDSSLVEAYKTAKKAGNLASFWPVVKAQVLKKLEAKVNELQPGGNNSILLVQYSNNMIGYMVGAKLKEVTKEEFLRDLNLRIQALTFDGITIPIDKNVEQFRASYIGKINIAIASQIDDLVAGNADTVILQEDVARNIKGTNLAPKSKNAFRYILQETVK